MTGVDIASYGRDLPGHQSLGAMLKGLLAEVPELRRLRLSSLDPAAIDQTCCDLVADEPRLLPHLHLSVQAGHDLVLKRMKRRHLRDDVIRLAHELRRLRPDLVFGADLIAGFPTEDEAMFQATLELVDEAGLTYLHVFPYSPRPGTPAARMPQLPLERSQGAGGPAAGRMVRACSTASCAPRSAAAASADGARRRRAHGPVRAVPHRRRRARAAGRPDDRRWRSMVSQDGMLLGRAA